MANFVNDGYKLSSDQLLISEFTKDILDYYNDLVWLMHSQNPDTIQYKDRDILRSRISDKYAKLSANEYENRYYSENIKNMVGDKKPVEKIAEIIYSKIGE